MIKERHNSEHRKGDAFDRAYRVREVVFDADVHRRIVHVVFNAFTVYDLKPADVLLSEVEIRAEIHAPTNGGSAQVKRTCGTGVDPGDLSEDRAHLNVTPIPGKSSMAAE